MASPGRSPIPRRSTSRPGRQRGSSCSCRARRVRAYYATRDPYPFTIWLWRLGDCAFVGVPGEPYSWLQLELRRRHPELAVFVLGVTNAEMSAYLPRDDCYDHELYQAWQTPYARGCLESVVEAADAALSKL